MERKTTKKVISALLLALFCWHMAGVSFFPHTHVINGVLISHSHPYSGSADSPGHSHSSVQFATISHLSMLFMVLTVVLGLAALYRALTARLSVEKTGRLTTGPVSVSLLRGPPYC